MNKYYFGVSLVAQTVKASAYNAGDPGSILWVGKIPWRRKWQPSPILVPGKSQGPRSLVGYSPWGRKESDTTEGLHFHFQILPLIRKKVKEKQYREKKNKVA